MMENLVIVGAGGFGREMYCAATESAGYGERFTIKGYLDERPGALDGFRGYPPVVGSPLDYRPAPGDVFITALGNIAARRKCVAALEAHGASFASIVHRTASVWMNAEIGPGAYVAQFAVVSADAKIGRHACVFQHSVIGHDCKIGDFAHIYAQCFTGGGVEVGEGAVMYPGSRIVPRRKIGAGAVVGIGAVAVLGVKPGETVFGNPAAPAGRRA